jgi:hypothetical protein
MMTRMLGQVAVDQVDEDLRADLRDLVESYATRRPVRSVAVVANAPLTHDVDRAAAIDAADLVIRCNSFVLDQGADAYCGRLTNVVVLNAGTRITRSVLDGYSSRLYLFSSPGAVYRRQPSVPMPTVNLWPDDLGAAYVPNRAVVAELRELVRAAAGVGPEDVLVPTTGAVAAWLALLLFPDADLLLTGFSAISDPHVTAWRHHGREDDGPVPVADAHKVDAEGILLRQWVADGRARYLS